jgi:hypothetical protein
VRIITKLWITLCVQLFIFGFVLGVWAKTLGWIS